MAATFRPRRVLVISNETVEADILHDTLVAHADATEVVVVAPALNTRLRHWLSDEDPAREAAQRRVDGCLAALTRAGVRVDGRRRGWRTAWVRLAGSDANLTSTKSSVVVSARDKTATTVRLKVGAGAVRVTSRKLRKATVSLRFAFTDGAIQTQQIVVPVR